MILSFSLIIVIDIFQLIFELVGIFFGNRLKKTWMPFVKSSVKIATSSSDKLIFLKHFSDLVRHLSHQLESPL